MLKFDVSIEPIDGEIEQDNNSAELNVRAITRPRRVLLMDGRPRWGFRYIRNLFDRDEHWEVNDLLVTPDQWGDPELERGDGHGKFPTKREELFTYDLIVFGEVPAKSFKESELEWISQFVSSRGGGLIFLDGRRGKLSQYIETPLEPLFPVEWQSADVETRGTIDQFSLTEHGRSIAALDLEGGSPNPAALWSEIPPPRWAANVRALPGCEVLVELKRKAGSTPALVVRRFGAGNVLYSAFDESWRARYEVADLFHQRYWNQVANWIMEPPYAVHNQFVSIDTGGFSYEKGEAAELSVRLRDEDGQPILEATTEAVLYRDDEIVATVPLTADKNAGGVFRGTTDELEPGTYQVGVRATEFRDDQLTARAAFTVSGDPTGQMNVLFCDEELLRQMAEQSGGEYLREEEIGQLPKLLESFSEFRVEDREIVLWRSWWWFTPIICLLTIEWVVRRKVGLM